MQYYLVPEDLLEDVEALRPWAAKALAVATRKRSKRPRRGAVSAVYTPAAKTLAKANSRRQLGA